MRKKCLYVIIECRRTLFLKVKGKSFTGMSQQRTIYYHRLWDKLSTTCSYATEVAQKATASCSRRQPATDKASDTVDSIDYPVPHTLTGSTIWAPVHSLKKLYKRTSKMINPRAAFSIINIINEIPLDLEHNFKFQAQHYAEAVLILPYDI